MRFVGPKDVAVVILVMLTVLYEVEVALRVTVANQFRAPVKVVVR
jgi:hypothetical protein